MVDFSYFSFLWEKTFSWLRYVELALACWPQSIHFYLHYKFHKLLYLNLLIFQELYYWGWIFESLSMYSTLTSKFERIIWCLAFFTQPPYGPVRFNLFFKLTLHARSYTDVFIIFHKLLCVIFMFKGRKKIISSSWSCASTPEHRSDFSFVKSRISFRIGIHKFDRCRVDFCIVISIWIIFSTISN